MNELTTIGVTPEALTGYNLNVYFYSSKWLEPLKKYIDHDHILPTRVPRSGLPSKAFIVRATSSYRGMTIPGVNYKVPRYFQLFFTAGKSSNGYWGQYTQNLMCYLDFYSKGDTHNTGVNSPRFTHFATKAGDEQELVPEFSDADPDYAVYPKLSVTRSQPFLVQDIRLMEAGVEYLLKLLSLTYQLPYTENTRMWLERK